MLVEQFFPPVFHHRTWIVNGTHTPVVLYRSRGEHYKDYYSWKLKRPALNTQVNLFLVLSCFTQYFEAGSKS